ncbi:hypothetical protein L7F22_029504 [Adiantum nelumboides]|nr:hypothetical protein [Adiantum nelumboides]
MCFSHQAAAAASDSSKPPSTLSLACPVLPPRTPSKRILEVILHHRIQLSGFLGDYLVATLAKCGAAVEAWKLSLTLPRRTVFSWSAIISAHVDGGHHSEALKLYQCMQEDNVQPNKFTLISLFKSCAVLPDLLQGKKLHECARRLGIATDAFVGSSLVNMYGKCGTIAEAEDAFCNLSSQDIISWTSMLSAYVEQGQGEKALLLYRQMLKEGLGAREITSVIALQACGILAEKEVLVEQRVKVKALALARALHADSSGEGYASHLMVGNTLVSVYGKCKSIVEAEHAFYSTSVHDVVSWNAMLSAYIEISKPEKTLQLYCQMRMESIEPEQVTFIMLLQACGAFAKKEEVSFIDGQPIKSTALELVNSLHIDCLRRGCASGMAVASTLVDVYGKCGSVSVSCSSGMQCLGPLFFLPTLNKNR